MSKCEDPRSISGKFSSLFRLNTNNDDTPTDFNPNDITTYPLNNINASSRFTAEERWQEYRRRGKSPSGVIDGIYNDTYRGSEEYNDAYRDSEANA